MSALAVILKFEDLEVWKMSSRLCADLYKHFQDVMGMLLLTTTTDTNSDFLIFCDSKPGDKVLMAHIINPVLGRELFGLWVPHEPAGFPLAAWAWISPS